MEDLAMPLHACCADRETQYWGKFRAVWQAEEEPQVPGTCKCYLTWQKPGRHDEIKDLAVGDHPGLALWALLPSQVSSCEGTGGDPRR